MSLIASARVTPCPQAGLYPPEAYWVVGVGSNREDAGAPVRCPGVGSAYNSPPNVIPHLGNVPEYVVKADAEVVNDILENSHSWSEGCDGFGEVGPEVSVIVCALSESGGAERLARVAASENVYGWDVCPVNEFNVAVVWYMRVVVGEDSACGMFVLDVPDRFRA